jgi:hypothetical protein
MSANPRTAITSAEEFRREILSRIATRFGCLVFLSSLREPSAGRYEHATLGRSLGAEETDRILAHFHYQVFSQWLASSLEEQKADLDEFVRESGNGVNNLFRYRDLVPRSARDVERQLYLTDLETLLQLLRL